MAVWTSGSVSSGPPVFSTRVVIGRSVCCLNDRSPGCCLRGVLQKMSSLWGHDTLKGGSIVLISWRDRRCDTQEWSTRLWWSSRCVVTQTRLSHSRCVWWAHSRATHTPMAAFTLDADDFCRPRECWTKCEGFSFFSSIKGGAQDIEVAKLNQDWLPPRQLARLQLGRCWRNNCWSQVQDCIQRVRWSDEHHGCSWSCVPCQVVNRQQAPQLPDVNWEMWIPQAQLADRNMASRVADIMAW